MSSSSSHHHRHHISITIVPCITITTTAPLHRHCTATVPPLYHPMRVGRVLAEIVEVPSSAWLVLGLVFAVGFGILKLVLCADVCTWEVCVFARARVCVCVCVRVCVCMWEVCVCVHARGGGQKQNKTVT
jgi:hypothetical protein